MRGLHLGTRPSTTTPPGGGAGTGRITFIVVDDVVYLTDPVTGYTYEAPVTFVGPTTLPSGLITAEYDELFFHYAGGTWSSPATQVEGATPVGGRILNDVFYVTIGSVTYAMPVTASGDIPGMPPGGETSLVTIDGVEYLRIVFPDGEVRYEEVHETPTPDAEGGGGGGVGTPVGAVGDGVADDTADFNAAMAAASAAAVTNGKGYVVCTPGKDYRLSSAVAIPDAVFLDITCCTITSSVATAFTLGQNSGIIGNGGVVVTSGASGAAIKKTVPTAVNGFFILGWPRLIATSARVAGSIGVDFTGSYKGVIEANVNDYETGILGGTTVDLATYYTELRSPHIVGCTTGIKLNPGANSTTILNAQINGSNVGTYGIHAVGVSQLAVLGGYLEQFVDAASTRGILLHDSSRVKVAGITLEITTSATANFAVGITGNSDCVSLDCVSPAGAWASSDKIVSHTASGTFSFLGGAPSNQVLRLGQSGWTLGEANGTIRANKAFLTGVEASVSAAADFANKLINTSDGIALLLENNSSGIGANRAPLIINRAGGSGFALTFQNNGSNAGGLVFGAGSPEGVVTAVPGTLYCNTLGGVGTSLYAKENGTGAVDWAALAGGGGAAGVAEGDSPTWTGKHVFSAAGAADSPTLKLTGVPFTGGTATTTKPLVLVEPTGTTSNNWSTLGTMLGANAPAGFAGNLIDAQLNGASKFKVSSGGAVTAVDDLITNSNVYSRFTGGLARIALDSVGIQFSNLGDLYVSRLGARNLRIGSLPSASPFAQTFTIGEASRPGTDSNVAGANGTVQSGLGTGTGTASSLIFQTPDVAAGGSGVQTYATRLTLDATVATFATNLTTGGAYIYASDGSIRSGLGGWFYWNGRSVMQSPSNGVIRFSNAADNDFSRLQLGGTTASFPAIKRNGAGIDFRLADDSDYCNVTLGNTTIASAKVLTTANVWNTTGALILKHANGDDIRIQNNSSTVPVIGFYTSAAVALSSIRSGTGTPEGVVVANIGSLFLRTDGGAGTSHYVKESGTGNTGWVAK